MFSFFSTLTLGAIAAVVAAYLQNLSWRHRNFEELRQREYHDAMRIVENLGTAIDKRLIAHRRFLAQVNSNSASNENYKDYIAALDDWMGQFSSFKTKIFLFFGRENALHFEYEVHQLLYETGAVILRTYEYGKANLSKNDINEHLAVGQRLGFTRYVATKFINKLNDDIVNYKFGTVQYINDISTGDLSKISRTYLALRLFGIKS